MIMFLAAAFRGIWTHLNWKWVPQPHPGCNGSGGEAWEVTRQKSETSVVKNQPVEAATAATRSPIASDTDTSYNSNNAAFTKKSISHDRPVSKFLCFPALRRLCANRQGPCHMYICTHMCEVVPACEHTYPSSTCMYRTCRHT